MLIRILFRCNHCRVDRERILWRARFYDCRSFSPLLSYVHNHWLNILLTIETFLASFRAPNNNKQPQSDFDMKSALLRHTATALRAEYDLDYGSKNSYVPQSYADGGQGTFGAVSPNDWKVPGTSPIGQASYAGAFDGGDEPWFSEAVSTVSLDLSKAEQTLKAFTKEAADFKIAAFCEANSVKDQAKAFDDLVGAMGYSQFLEASPKQLLTAYEKITGKPAKKEE